MMRNMQPQDKPPQPPKGKIEQKRDKRADALRENLKKRKLQAKQRDIKE